MIRDYDYENLHYEAHSHVIQVSSHPSYLADVKEKYGNDELVASEVEIVIDLFKNKDCSTLKREYNDHALTRAELSGFRSLHLFPRTAKDILIVYPIFNIFRAVRVCNSLISASK